MKTLHTIYNNFAKRNLARLLTIFIILFTLSIVHANATKVTDKVYTFGSSSTPSGWRVNSSNSHASGYLKFSANDYLEMTVEDIFAEGEILSSNTIKVEVSCGTFGTWSSPKSVLCSVELRTSNGEVLTTNNATFSSLTNSEATYRTPISVDKPNDPSKIAYLRITFSNFTSTSTGTLRVKYVKLNYETSTPTPSGYAVTYNNGGRGTAPSNTTASSVTLSAITATGYTNTGWKANVAVKNTSTGATIDANTLITNGTNVTLTQATTFTAQWQINSYTVTWKPNGGNWSGNASDKVEDYNYGATITTPTNPTRYGYNFTGWNPTPATTMPASDQIYTAQWTEKSLTNYRTTCSNKPSVSFDLNGGSGTFETETLEDGDSYTIPGNEPTRDGYNFAGWKINGEGDLYQPGATINDITEPITLVAQWTAKTATSLTWSADTYTATIDAVNDFPELTKSPADLSPIAYSSSNTGVATIDENTGEITLKAAGTTTITATFTETATHAGSTAPYTLTVNPSNCRWVETDIANINSGDEVVITMTSGLGVTYALPSNQSTGSNPQAITVEIDGNCLKNNASTQYVWIINKDGENLTFESLNHAGYVLNCTNEDAGVRVSSGSDKKKIFVIDPTSGYLKNTQTTDARYLGVHNTNYYWYCYKTYGNNTGGQTLKFYKRECLDASKVWVEGNLTNVTCDTQLPLQLAKNGSITLTFTAADGYMLPNTVTVTNATKTWNQTTGELTISNPTGNVMVTVEAVELHTITWMVGGSELTTGSQTTSVENGKQITAIPAKPNDNILEDCGATKFMGWSTDNIGSTPDADAPTDLFTTVAEAQSKIGGITENKTFYAVFATASGISDVFSRVTDLSQLEDGNTLAIVAEQSGGQIFGTGSDHKGGEVPVESDGKITISVSTNKWILEKVDGGWKLLKDENNKLCADLGYTAYGNTLTIEDSQSDKYFFVRSSTKYLEYYSNTWQFFNINGTPSASQNGFVRLKIYKSNVSYSNYVTSCCETPAPTNGTYDNVTGSGNTMSLTLKWEGSASRYHITGGNLAAEGVYTSETSCIVYNLTECEEYTFNITAYPEDGCESAAIQISAQPFSGAKTVTFVYGNEQPNTTFTTDCKNQSTALPTPTRSGYRLLGWFTEESGGTEITEDPYTPATDITLYAQWVQVFTVTYNANNATSGTVPTDANSPYDINKIVTVQGNTGNLQRLGYNFVGWNTASDASGTQYSAGQTFTITENTTLYAQWIENYCTLTFTIPSGGGQAVSAPEQVLNGYQITFPEVTGISSEYWCETFIGWTTEEPNGEGLWDGTPTIYESGTNSEAITANTTFYAVYQRSGGGASGTVDLKCEDVFTWKSDVLSGNSNAYGTVTTRTATDGSVWTTNGQIADAGDINLKEEYYLKLPELPGSITTIRMKVSQGNCIEACRDIAGNETEYKVNFKSTTDGNVLFSSETTKSRSRTIEITDGTYYTGYLYCSSGTLNVHAVSVDYGPAPIISHSLQCGCAIDEFDLTYNANETNFPNSTTNCEGVTGYKFSEHEDKYTICSSVPTLDGYKFIGWTTNPNGSGDLYTSGQEIKCVPSSDITLYAQYERVYTVIFDNQNTINATTQTRSGAAVDVPTATEPCGSEWQFVGWSTEEIAPMSLKPTITIEPGINTYIPEGNVTLYAIYQKTSLSKEFVAGKTGAYKISNGSDKYASTFYNSYLQSVNNLADATTYYITYTASDGGKYTIQQADGQYIAYSGASTSLKQSEEPYYWKITKDGELWQVATIPAGRYLKYSTDFRAYESNGNIGLIATEGQYYYRTMSCDDNFDITFNNQNGATIHWQDGYPQAAYQDLEAGTTITTFPTASYEGWTFIGWRAQEYEESTSAPESSSLYGGLDGISGNELTITADVTMYPVFTQFLDNDPFDEVNGGDYYMYYIADENLDVPGLDEYGVANRIYAAEYEDYGFRSTQSCADATLFTFAKLPNGKWTIYDNTRDKFVYGVNNDNKLEDKAQTGDGKIKYVKEWTIEVNEGNQVNAVSVDGYILSAYTQDAKSGTFKNYDDDNLTNGNENQYHRVYIGTCTERVFTTAPSTEPIITLNGDVKVTSTATQSVKAASMLTVSASNIATSNLSITSDNAAFIVSPTTITVVDKKVGVTPITITYNPTITSDDTETATITVSDGNEASESITVTGRHLPENFVIAAKWGDNWYALPANCVNSGDSKQGILIDVNDINNPTSATAPTTTKYGLRGVKPGRQADFGQSILFTERVSGNQKALHQSGEDNENIWVYAQYANVTNENATKYEWTPSTNDLTNYTFTHSASSRKLGVNENGVFGAYTTDVQVRLLPATFYEQVAVQVIKWKANSVIVMYTGAETTATTQVGTNAATDAQTLANQKITHGIYELTTNQSLTANAGKILTMCFGEAQVKVEIPLIVNGGTTTASKNGHDVVILDGGKLTASTTLYSYKNVYVYGGGKLAIPDGTQLGVNNIILRAGGVATNGAGQDPTYQHIYPQVELKGTLSTPTNASGFMKYEYVTDYDHWYHLVLPFNAQYNTITYPQEYYGDNVKSNNTGSWQIKRYAGEIRATGNYDAWVDIETENANTVTAGKGYIYWAAPKKVTVNGSTERQKWGIQRITLGKTPSVATTEENQDKKISGLSSYATIQGNSGKDNDQGWNLIGNPYMMNLSNMDETGLQVGKLVEEEVNGKWTGRWEWLNDGFRYLTIPSDHFDTYTAKTISAATPLVAGRAFFVQLADEANAVTFKAANRPNLMPALRATTQIEKDIETGIVLSNETLQDEVNFWIKDGKTNDYEYNADYPKTPNNNRFNIYGVHTNGDLSWVAISPELAAESMPIGYQVPAAGTYTLSLSETYYSEDLESLYLTDHEMSPEVTVDLINAPYEFSVNQAETNNERFTISLKLKSEIQGPTTGWENIDVGKDHPTKFIHQDRLYILRDGVIYDATGQEIQTINK